MLRTIINAIAVIQVVSVLIWICVLLPSPAVGTFLHLLLLLAVGMCTWRLVLTPRIKVFLVAANIYLSFVFAVGMIVAMVRVVNGTLPPSGNWMVVLSLLATLPCLVNGSLLVFHPTESITNQGEFG